MGRSLSKKLPFKEKNKEFSFDTMSILDCLNSTARSFIVLKYQECLSYDEISSILGISLEDVKKLERNILEELRNNELFKKSFQEYFR